MVKKKTRTELTWNLMLKQEKMLRKKHGEKEFFKLFAFFLDDLPNPKCKKCFGRGVCGFDKERNRVIPCSCVKGWQIKKIDEAEEGQVIMKFDGSIIIYGKCKENED